MITLCLSHPKSENTATSVKLPESSASTESRWLDQPTIRVERCILHTILPSAPHSLNPPHHQDMNKNLTEIAYILDRSGSMGGMVEPAIAGFNHFLT
jgi:hypothetical protein